MICEWRLPEDSNAARAARLHVSTQLESLAADDHVIDDAVLIASELAANAVRHGSPPAVLRLEISETSLRIEVRDGGSTTEPVVSPPSLTAGSGRGLAIVEQLARDHGWTRDADGVTVWAELDLRARPSR